MLFYYSKSMSLTKEECSCKCADNDKCVAWTFAKGYYYIIPFFCIDIYCITIVPCLALIYEYTLSKKLLF